MGYEDAAHGILVAHAAGLWGQRVTDLENHARDYLGKHNEIFRRFSAPVMRLLRKSHDLVAVTAEPDYMAKAVIKMLGMNRALTSEYEIQDGRFTGMVTVSLAHRDQKKRLIGGLRPDFAFGDSAGDIDMLDHAHYAYCISPDSALTTKARDEGWEIFNGDTDAEEMLASIKNRLRSVV